MLVKLLKILDLNSQGSTRPPLKDVRWEDNAEWQRIKRFCQAKRKYYRGRRELMILTKAFGLEEQEFSEKKKIPESAEEKKKIPESAEKKKDDGMQTEGGTDDPIVMMMLVFETLST